jgi:uncharacterized membrane protein
MKRWDFKVKSNVQEIITKLNASLGTTGRFILDVNQGEHNSATFKIQKRGLYAFYLMFLNKITVKGKILKTDTENETHIEITFTQYFLWKLVIFSHLLLCVGFLIAIFSKSSSSAFMYLIGGILVAVGIILWITVQNKFKKDIEEYKTLISGILEV